MPRFLIHDRPGPMSRELAAALLFAAGSSLAFLFKPFHMDEPAFLAVAGQILRHPLHPLSFVFNWYGEAVPEWRLNTNPLAFHYLLAGALRLTGGGEAMTRLCFIPFDLAAAASLYLLAARFLLRPLAPTLIVLACPAYLLNMSQLIPEKAMAPFAFFSLYALDRGVAEGRRGWYLSSAALLGGAVLFKYHAVFLLFPVLAYSFQGRVPLRRLAAYLLIATALIAVYFAADVLLGGVMTGSAWDVIGPSAKGWWSHWPHKTRSILAFCGGGGVVTALWPYLAARRRHILPPALVLAAVGFVFLPVWDAYPVSVVDRLMGALLSAGALLGFWELWTSPERGRGAALWAGWASGAALVLISYHSIVSRLVAFLIAPLIMALAEIIERRWTGRRLDRLHAASLCGVLVVSAAVSAVDWRFASAQRQLSEEVARSYIAQGRRVWFLGHWGLQYYLERAGAVALDRSRGGWDQAKPGDVVVSPIVNADVFRPKRRLLSNVRVFTVGSPIPVRLMSRWDRQGGFYSSVWGFLPFCLSDDPVEEFHVVELL